MLAGLRSWMADRPLAALTFIALLPRLVAAFFSGGYFAHDDHFLVIEAASSWAHGFDYNHWLPWNQGDDPRPSGHSFFYVGLHYLLFVAMKTIGLADPKAQMVVVRLLHALWSLVIVRTGYRIALRMSDSGIAWRTGLFLALLGFMPFLAVRNLVETACIPFLMLGVMRLLRAGGAPTWQDALIAGLWIGMAMNTRFQTIFFAAGIGLAMLLLRQWRGTIYYAGGMLIALLLVQGGIDLFLWGRPFAELTEYIGYNLLHTTTYFDQPWYNYLLLLAAVFIPPFSIAVFFGFFRRAGPLVAWLPVLVFLAAHSYFPNKQERFILPIVPLFFIIGHVSWEQWRTASPWWTDRAGLWRGVMRFTWAVNILLLAVLSVSYSKRGRVEALYLLRGQADVHGLVVEDTHEGEPPMPPLHYWGQWDATIVPWADRDADLAEELARYEEHRRPNVVLFIGEEDLEARMRHVAEHAGALVVIGRAEPGLLDRVVHWLNPINRNEAIVVARIGA
ncbi:MAG: glycosyltransferase family 39 protein [Flavobacteriales bacterium]|nr:glycosyltransferase family 39 protein [Flavobacteriales bacterium]